ncbi:hypothetical protein [Aquimarina sp. MMG016]|uniref:hypothetical protein n=1 Tax=Aquimarina sp. MMG016 TaxID=2822690 RepID=UPI001B39D101|nr:hypothetical protein [Aquimarina sp. MMG016]MBQ4819765.1 hypothetical protein [Aquimarina sp. MMG016]
MKTEYIVLKETTLTNNCPECYSNDGMLLSFKQEKRKSKLMVRTKSNVIESIVCGKCESKIFPGIWTPDIERVYDYHRKTITPKSGSMQFTGLSYALILLTLLIITGGYLYLKHPEIIGLG